MLPVSGECRNNACPATLCEQMKRELRCFSFLFEEDVEQVNPYFRCWTLSSGEDLWRSGETEAFMAFIISGKIELKVDTEFPGKQVVVGVFSRGSVIGTASVLDHQPRSTTARALEDSGAILLTREELEALLTAHPQIGIRLLKGVLLSESHRLSRAYARLASIF